MLDQLPFDISYQILLLVDPFDLIRWMRVSRSWRKLLSHPLILEGSYLHDIMIRRHFPSAVHKILVRHALLEEIRNEQSPRPPPTTIKQTPFDRETLLSLMRTRANALAGRLCHRANVEVPGSAYNELGMKCKYDSGFCLVWSEGNRSMVVYDFPFCGESEAYCYTLSTPRREKVLTATIGGGKLVTATLDITEEWLHVNMIDLRDLRSGKMRCADPLPVRKLRLPLGPPGTSTFQDTELLPEGHVPLLFGSTPLIVTNGRIVAFSDSYVSKVTTWRFADDDDENGAPPNLLGTFDTTAEWRQLFDRVGNDVDPIESHLPLMCGMYIPQGTDDVIPAVFVHELQFKWFALMPMTAEGRPIKGPSAPHTLAMPNTVDPRRVTFSVFESCRDIYVRSRFDDLGPLLKLVRRPLPKDQIQTTTTTSISEGGSNGSKDAKSSIQAVNYEYVLESVHPDILPFETPSEEPHEPLDSPYFEKSSTDHMVWIPASDSHRSTMGDNGGTGFMYSWSFLPLTKQVSLKALSVSKRRAPGYLRYGSKRRRSTKSGQQNGYQDSSTSPTTATITDYNTTQQHQREEVEVEEEEEPYELEVKERVDFNPNFSAFYNISAAQGDDQCMFLAFEHPRYFKIFLRLLEFGEYEDQLSGIDLVNFDVQLRDT